MAGSDEHCASSEHPQCTERVPPTRFTHGFAKWQGELLDGRIIEKPSTIGLRPALDDVHGIPDAHVGLNTGVPEPSKNGFAPNSSSQRKPASRRATADSTAALGTVDADRARRSNV